MWDWINKIYASQEWCGRSLPVEVNDEMHPDDAMIYILDLRVALGLMTILHSRTDKRETQGKLSSALLHWLLKCFLRWMAGGRMLREKRISAVKQSSSWMGFFSKPCLPQAARFSYPASPVASHKWLPHLLAKKNSLNWNSHWFQTTGPQVALPCLRLFTCFMLLLSLQPSFRALLKAYLGVIHLFWK